MSPKRFTPVAVAVALAAQAAPASADVPWTSTTIPSSAGALGPADIVFDRQGDGIASWTGFLQDRSPQKFSATAVRDPASGAWTAPSMIPGLTWGNLTVASAATSRTILLSQKTASLGRYNRAVFNLVYAFGHTGEPFGSLRTLAEGVSQFTTASNPSGDTLTVYSDRAGKTYVAQRAAGHNFGTPHAINAQPSAVAISARGDRVIAWWAKGGVYTRIARAGHGWGSVIRAVSHSQVANSQVRLAFTPSGRIVLGWSEAVVSESTPPVLSAGVAIRDRSGPWHPFSLESRQSPAQDGGLSDSGTIPFVDSTGNAYVAWTGVAAATTAVKVARVTSSGAGTATVLSPGVQKAVLDDVAAGPGGTVGVSWTSTTANTTSDTYASIGRNGSFDAAARLTPAGTTGLGYSRIAFQPLTAQAVVTWGYATEGHGAIAVSTSPALG